MTFSETLQLLAILLKRKAAAGRGGLAIICAESPA